MFAKSLTMGNYEAWTENRCYGLRIPSKVVSKMLGLCRVVPDTETGGILVGYYNRSRDCAVVTECSGAPRDSRRGKNFFYRGVHGLQCWLSSLWNLGQRRYYLGEWHFHPFAKPDPSNTDLRQMRINAEDKSYHCPEVLMFIIGGDPNAEWTCRSFVYSRQEGLIELGRSWERNRVRA